MEVLEDVDIRISAMRCRARCLSVKAGEIGSGRSMGGAKSIGLRGKLDARATVGQ